MNEDPRKIEMKTVLDAFEAHAEEDRITENWLYLRGAGFDTRFQPTTVPASKAAIEINAQGVQLSGFHVDMIDCADPDCIGIKKTGKYLALK